MSQTASRTQKEWMELHADVLIPHVAPRFYLGRTSAGNVCRLAPDLPDSVAAELRRVARDEPVSNEPNGRPVFADNYRQILEELAPVTEEWAGPAFRFPARVYAHSLEVIQVTKDTIEGEAMRLRLRQVGHQ